MFFGLGDRVEWISQGSGATATTRAAGRTASSALGARLLRQGLACGGIVSGAGLYFVILFGFNFQFTVSAVELGVSRGVANVVLAAQFCGDLIKSLFQFVELIAANDHPAASCFGEFMHFAFAGVGHANAKITATIGAEQDIDDGIG